MILYKMQCMAEECTGTRITRTVLPVPVYFNDSQRQATKDAGLIAGLNVLRIINEPTAAAIAYKLNKNIECGQVRRIFVFDLGATSLDLTLMEVDDCGIFEFLQTSGDLQLGGRDFDRRLTQHCAREFQRLHGLTLDDSPRALGRLRLACERIKRKLSRQDSATLEVDHLLDRVDFQLTITQREFEEMNMDLFNRCVQLVEGVLNAARVDTYKVTDFVLSGGSLHIPKLRQMLRDFFNNGKTEFHLSINPEEVVAAGAAIQAAILSEKKPYEDLLPMVVIGLGLGVEIAGGQMRTLMPRNMTIPAVKKQVFSTNFDNQTSLEIKLYMGEHSQTRENIYLGSFEMVGIPPAPRGVPEIELKFEIDANGYVLKVQCQEISTGKLVRMTLTLEFSFSSEDIQRRIRDAQTCQFNEEYLPRLPGRVG
jgi:L1 cell adhesion molecule like protein